MNVNPQHDWQKMSWPQIVAAGLTREELHACITARAKSVDTTRESPSKLPMTSIIELPDLFQFRDPLTHESQMHIRELSKHPKGGRPLSAVTIWWAGDSWLLLDGHHRLEAYRAANWKHDVPVTCFEGSPSEAIWYAAQANCLPQMQMNKQERMNAAWRLTISMRYSKARIADATSISLRQVGNMRAVAETLKAQGVDPHSLTWGQALMKSRGASPDEVDWAEREEEITQDFANKLLKALGQVPNHKKPLLAAAIARYDRQLPGEVASYLDSETLERLLKDRLEYERDLADSDF